MFFPVFVGLLECHRIMKHFPLFKLLCFLLIMFSSQLNEPSQLTAFYSLLTDLEKKEILGPVQQTHPPRTIISVIRASSNFHLLCLLQSLPSETSFDFLWNHFVCVLYTLFSQFHIMLYPYMKPNLHNAITFHQMMPRLLRHLWPLAQWKGINATRLISQQLMIQQLRHHWSLQKGHGIKMNRRVP